MYTNIFTLIKEHHFKKIYIRRNTWTKDSYARIDAIITDNKSSNMAKAIGYGHYANGVYEYKLFDTANCDQWTFVGQLEQDILFIEDPFYYRAFKWKYIRTRKEYDIALDKIKNKILLK